MDDLLQNISHYGYAGLFGALILGIVGLPIPDETLLVFFGYLASRGSMHLGLTWLTALLGSVSGISVSYWIGRSAGYGFVHRYGRYIHFTEERLGQILGWFDRIGHWLLTIGYYIPGVRHCTALVAGMSGMKYRPFAAYAYPGALLWVSTFVSIGYFLGEKWKSAFAGVHRDIVIAVVAIGGIGWIIWTVMSRRKASASARVSKNGI
jgi:membrane protein DedA with SNARE-associated domain